MSLPYNPLKTTTAEIHRGWQQELQELQRRWHEIQAGSGEAGPTTPEAEGLQTRSRVLHDLLAEAEILEGDPSSWQSEASVVRLGSLIRLAFADGEESDFLLVGLAGPVAPDNVLTPRTPLGAAVLGRAVGDVVTYVVSAARYEVTIRRCLAPGSPDADHPRRGQRAIAMIVGSDEGDEANQVAFALLDLLGMGTSPDRIAVTWRAPFQSAPLETALASGGIHYRLEGTNGFHDQPAVRGLIAIFRLAAHPDDCEAAVDALRIVARVPAEDLVSLAAEWRGPERLGLPKPLLDSPGVASLLRTLDDIWSEGRDLSPEDALLVMRKYLLPVRPDLVRDGFDTPWRTLVRTARPYRRIGSFLAHADEIAGQSRHENSMEVRLIPLAEMGKLDLAALFLIGANEGALPYLPTGDADTITAERELFYRALAGAPQVTLSWARTIGGQLTRPSPFLAEIGET